MLSKIRFFLNETDFHLTERKSGIDLVQAVRYLSGDVNKVIRVKDGTIGVSFIIEVNGVSRFMKTHAVSDESDNILKEYTILSRLYGEEIKPEIFSVIEHDCERKWLVMDMLVYPEGDIAINGIFAIISWYTEKLRVGWEKIPIKKNDNFLTMINLGWNALENMSNSKVLSRELVRKIDFNLSLISKRIIHFPTCLCHGDLGPKNIMCDKTKPIVIDWEDAFKGVEGYDYLYWLTFMSNRKFYSKNILGCTLLGKELETAIMTLIILLKSELSYRRGDYKRHKLSAEQRLTEVLSLQ